jgi:hypothetical protein
MSDSPGSNLPADGAVPVGSEGLRADRRASARVAQVAPWVVAGARDNRRFLTRAVRYLAGAGVEQFLDLGSGLPAAGNVHEVAQTVRPRSRVVYVDNDPVVLAHARALLATDARTAVVDGDLTDPAAVLDDPVVHAHLDLSRPVAVLLVSVLHFVIDDDQAATITATLRERLAPGSALALSHVADLTGHGTSAGPVTRGGEHSGGGHPGHRSPVRGPGRDLHTAYPGPDRRPVRRVRPTAARTRPRWPRARQTSSDPGRTGAPTHRPQPSVTANAVIGVPGIRRSRPSAVAGRYLT